MGLSVRSTVPPVNADQPPVQKFSDNPESDCIMQQVPERIAAM